MDSKKKKTLFGIIIAIALIILIGVGSTFAYFSASITADNVISTTSAEFEIDLEEDVSLIKTNIIPSIEEYVDIASRRVNSDGELLKPYKESEESDKLIIDDTVCIDDNLNEICSVYTFTVKNPNTDNDLPLYITLDPSINTFENLYYKVIEYNQETKQFNEVVSATQIIDNRYVTYEYTNPKTQIKSIKYRKNEETGEWIKKANFDELTKELIVLTGEGKINKTLDKAVDEETPSEVTYHIVTWIMETHEDQTHEDSGRKFAARLNVSTGPEGTGITGVFSSAGTE